MNHHLCVSFHFRGILPLGHVLHPDKLHTRPVQHSVFVSVNICLNYWGMLVATRADVVQSLTSSTAYSREKSTAVLLCSTQ